MEPTIQDFSTWKEVYNITSWNYNSLYPYFRKMFDDIKYNVGGVIQSQVSFFRDYFILNSKLRIDPRKVGSIGRILDPSTYVCCNDFSTNFTYSTLCSANKDFWP